MSKSKNVVQGSEIEAGGDVNIGDRTTINVYGFEANKKDLEFVIKFYMGLIVLFAIAALVFLVYPAPKENLQDYVAAFAAGGFFALASLLLVVFIKANRESSIPKIVQ